MCINVWLCSQTEGTTKAYRNVMNSLSPHLGDCQQSESEQKCDRVSKLQPSWEFQLFSEYRIDQARDKEKDTWNSSKDCIQGPLALWVIQSNQGNKVIINYIKKSHYVFIKPCYCIFFSNNNNNKLFYCKCHCMMYLLWSTIILRTRPNSIKIVDDWDQNVKHHSQMSRLLLPPLWNPLLLHYFQSKPMPFVWKICLGFLRL